MPSPSSVLRVSALLLLVGCGKMKADDYVVEFTDTYCNLRLSCGDTAGLVFDGADTLESCQAVYGPDFAAQGAGCVLKSKLANQCLDELSALACPDDGNVDAVLPAVCSTVWIKCEDVPDPTSSTEETGIAG
ncbi:MAG: hypothetical protein KC621_22270 [Myxococcales bacterium]|nr:hypothetical protein [Myxococcales bacterium]